MRKPIKSIFNHKYIRYLVVVLCCASAIQDFAFAQASQCVQLLSFQIIPRETVVCQGKNVSFGTGIATSYGNFDTFSYDWYLNGVLQPTPNGDFTITDVKTYDTVYAVIHCSVSGSCPATATSNKVGFYVNPSVYPTINIQSSQNGPACPGSAITYAAHSTNGGSPTFNWQVNGVTVASSLDSVFVAQNLKDGDRVNCILVAFGVICLADNNIPSDTLTARFLPETAPSVSISASANNVYPGIPITFTANTLNTGSPTDYQWQVNGINVGTDSVAFTTNALSNGDIVSCIINTNIGCIAVITSNSLTVSILPPPPIVPPNTFTPNGDGINDTWKLSSLLFYPNMQVKVFNRYGVIVFQSHGYGKQWDGTDSSTNRPLPDGVYYYLIDPGNGVPKESGWVAIIR